MLLHKLEEKDIHLLPSDELIAHDSSRSRGIRTVGFDPQVLSRTSGIGARPIKRMIQKELLNEMSRQIIAGTLEPGKPQVIDVFDGKIVVRKPIAEKESRLEGRDDNGNGKKKAKAKAWIYQRIR
ncbi:MAG: hypothetical protein JNL43_16190 [Flavobacteriales bacterium]|nr:hypothetical protein [Flavobacteriales bacterium]